MMHYLIADWISAANGERKPDLPPSVDYSLYAEPSPRDASFGLFRVSVAPKDLISQSVLTIDSRLQAQIRAAEGFPPALALAREETARRISGPNIAKTRFTITYLEVLEEMLAAQDVSPFFLARAKVDEPGLFCRGGFYWLIGHDPQQRTVKWVSDDYYVQIAPQASFEVPSYQLPRLMWIRGANRLYDAIPSQVSDKFEGEVRACQLQAAIDEIVSKTNVPLRFDLGPGSDVVDLRSNVDIGIVSPGHAPRRITVISRKWAGSLCEPNRGPGGSELFATGSPLIIVREITPRTIVKGVLKYLDNESSTKW
jgi:hypothetical protein